MTTPDARSGTGRPAELFFEDLVPGLSVDLGVVTVDGDEMVAFARRFDPQWYHVDPGLAEASRHGGLIASGFYTVSLFMRAYVDHLLSRAAADASPGLEELRWLAPVRAGDRLAVRVDVMGARPSTARPGLGTVSLTGTMLRLGPDDRPEQEVLRTRFRGWFAVRPVEAEVEVDPAGPTNPGPAGPGPAGPGPADPGPGPAEAGPGPGTPGPAATGPATPGPAAVSQRPAETSPVETAPQS
ncbi:MaoC/PaaZ C-terminal domain-containing protein [Micromonospora sp. WMMD1120]|uniref:MaoC/PaaZ C-terminal domain-containing protein n=1 Tax=Micromonospora sp. WMMD1120 TaxID=3016106 RepID=UPI002417FA9F|nr:MaoC/PaaZ C-terminal domain-containing protein [Micromonospora sp. WMMD1120]MDG4807885.1 MaoC/PaaZ C-terminal domain-containing protein [Micromonospora sp. WMMD1120]